MEYGWGFRCPLQSHHRRFNTAVGGHALYGNIFQSANTAAGAFALAANNPGNQNVAVGQGVLRNNTGDGNAAVGYKALFANTSGSQNVAVGQAALRSNIMDTGNTAVGFQAATLTGGFINATASGVTAFAYQALRNNNLDDNTAIGYQALLNNLNGIRNTAVR